MKYVPLVLIVFFCGCNKLAPEVISGIHLAKASAVERAVFMAEKAGDDVYLKQHVDGLRAQAAALVELEAAIQINKGSMGKAARLALENAADTAEARAKLFRVWYLKKTNPEEWMTAHYDALEQQATLLTAIKIKLVTEDLQNAK
jgi:hypothetical protein